MKVRLSDILSVLTKSIVLIFVVFTFLNSVNDFNSHLPTPVKIYEVQHKEDPRIAFMHSKLSLLGCSDENRSIIAKSIIDCSDKVHIDPVLIAVLMKTESDFDKDAISSKGYRSLMQTPTSSGFEDVDILHGCRILEEKIKFAHGDMELAIALYKGGNNKQAKMLARKVMKTYERIRT